MKYFLLFFGLIVALIGVILIYDARPITKKLFNYGDQNEATLGFKMLGFIFVTLGGILVYFNMI